MLKIVIVDDDAVMHMLLRSLCENAGHEVVAEFDSGAGILDYVAQHNPDVVCLDFNLPGLDGLEVLRELSRVANHVDVLMISGADDPDLAGKAADAGATGFVRKPFEDEQIVAELQAIERNRRIAAQAAAAGDTPAAPPKAANRSDGVVPRSAVVVDDSASIRLLLKGILQGCGIKVLGLATNGRDGIEMAERLRPAIVCLDVDMPVMTGLEALPQIHQASPQTHIVMITGNASRTVVAASIAGGAKGYFLKPIRPAVVEEFIGKLLKPGTPG